MLHCIEIKSYTSQFIYRPGLNINVIKIVYPRDDEGDN